MNFGPMSSEPDSYVIMDAALEAGVNFFDTANRYGAREGRGHTGLTEEIIGRWWARGGGRREKVVLATKLFGAMGDWPNEGKLSALNIRRACEASLRRLQTDYIDIYQMHHVDRETPWDEIWQGMEQLQREGKILYVGSSNFAGWHIAKACEAARQRQLLRADHRAVQVQSELARSRDGVVAGLPGLRRGRHPLESAGRRLAGRRAAQD